MIKSIREEGTTVIITTHYMDEAEYCDRISMMVEGRLEAIGSLPELLKKYDSVDMDEVFIKLARGK